MKTASDGMVSGAQAQPRTDGGRIPCLDGLRAVSILFVLVSHGQHTIPGGIPAAVGFLGARGDLGVLTFFVLSGYLITFLLRREKEKTGRIRLRDFYVRRALRIFPAFYTYLATLALLCVLGVLALSKLHFLYAATYLWNYKHLFDPHPEAGGGGWFLGHIWTLSMEEQFYLLWPGALVLFGLRRSARLAVGLIFAMPAFRLGTYVLFPSSRGQILMMAHTGADALMFGCVLALWQGRPRFQATMKRLDNAVWPVVAILFAWIVSPLVEAKLPQHLAGGYAATLGRSLSGLSVAFLMAWLLRHPSSLGGRFLSTPLMVYVGVLSYSLYLWQQLFLTELNHTWTGRFPWNLACAVLVGTLSYQFIERPFLNLRKRFKRAPVANVSCELQRGSAPG